MSIPERALVDRVRHWLGLDEGDQERDPLPGLIEEANVAADEAWDVVNLSRCRRGEAPIRPPSWDDVLQQKRGACRES